MLPPSSRHSRFYRLSSIVEHLVDRRVGIVRYVEEVRREAGAPDFFHFQAKAGNTAAFSALENFSNSGGAAADRETAVAKAIGEAVERYCSAIFDYEALTLSSYEEASFPCVAPSEFALYSRGQYEAPGFPWAPFHNSTKVRWIAARDLTTGKVCYVPAAKSFIPYIYYEITGDTPIDQPISTGLACHVSEAEAALNGVCEVIERDAFLITWQAMLSPPQIRIETLSEEGRDLVQRFQRTGSAVVLFDITLDHGVPTVLSVLRGSVAFAPALVFAASASPDPDEAVRKSLEELAHTRRYCSIIKAHVPRLVPAPPDHLNVTSQMEHLNFWVDEKNAPLADWIFSSPKRVEFSQLQDLATGDPARDLEALMAKIQEVNERVLIADLTTPDVAELGFSVIRAIIPGFHPLHLGYTLRALGGRRLWEVPQQLGYPGITPNTGDNPQPHPYP
jgi:ribosomal protein S12 methylthiotransferase accessory factor